jgi:hypothetical protein
MSKKGSGARPFYQPQFLVRPFGLPSPWFRNLHRRTREREREERGSRGLRWREKGWDEREEEASGNVHTCDQFTSSCSHSKLAIPYSLSLRELFISPPHELPSPLPTNFLARCHLSVKLSSSYLPPSAALPTPSTAQSTVHL